MYFGNGVEVGSYMGSKKMSSKEILYLVSVIFKK